MSTPTKLLLDDGSRLPHSHFEPSTSLDDIGTSLRNESTSITEYYEVERVARHIVECLFVQNKKINNDSDDGFLCRVALQLPDELLQDAARVTWEMEEAITHAFRQHNTVEEKVVPSPLVFILGDTTFTHCCPDEIGALHLNADILVHYGAEACFSPTLNIPVIYSFGAYTWDVHACASTLVMKLQQQQQQREQQEQQQSLDHLLLLYQPQYHGEIKHLKEMLLNHQQGTGLTVVMASFSSPQQPRDNDSDPDPEPSLSSCMQRSCSCAQDSERHTQLHTSRAHLNHPTQSTYPTRETIRIGNLLVPLSPEEFAKYLLVYIGDEEASGTSQDIHRHFLRVLLRCTPNTLHTHDDDTIPVPLHAVKPREFWAYHPKSQILSTQPILQHTSKIQQFLKRRFYLIQRASRANVMGILVGTLSQQKFTSVISTVQKKIIQSGRACYTLAVGKIHNVAKLANFAEIDCFILVACTETSILPNEREYHVPILTPQELDVALGIRSWDPSTWSCDYFDYLDEKEKEEEDEEEDESTMPNSVSSVMVQTNCGGGQIVEYHSEAAEYWKRREYKGLEAQVGKSEARAAVIGQTGIASDYGNK